MKPKYAIATHQATYQSVCFKDAEELKVVDEAYSYEQAMEKAQALFNKLTDTNGWRWQLLTRVTLSDYESPERFYDHWDFPAQYVSSWEAEEEYDTFIDNTYPDIDVCGEGYAPSYTIKAVDPERYEREFEAWLSDNNLVIV